MNATGTTGSVRTLLVGIDDTDNATSTIGTGKLARMLGEELERRTAGLAVRGVVRHQLLLDPRVPYTTHNSPACLVVGLDTTAAADAQHRVQTIAREVILRLASEGSDPGLCLIPHDAVTTEVIDFGLRATFEVLTKSSALETARRAEVFLQELGGTGDGVIGALAATALTCHGNGGRYLELGGFLRTSPAEMSAAELRCRGIEPVSLDPRAGFVPDHATVVNHGWLRPRRIGGAPVLLLTPDGERWRSWDELMREKAKGTAQ